MSGLKDRSLNARGKSLESKNYIHASLDGTGPKKENILKKVITTDRTLLVAYNERCTV